MRQTALAFASFVFVYILNCGLGWTNDKRACDLGRADWEPVTAVAHYQVDAAAIVGACGIG